MLDKIANTQYPIHELLRSRWSPLAFSSQPVELEKLHSVLEAGRWAASSYNEQPWYFIVATKDNPAEFEQLLSCLVAGNQIWAKAAPVLLLSIAKLSFERNGQLNRHAWHDVGAATANLTIQATALGLFAHAMAGYDSLKAREVFNIPEGYEPVAAIALGYIGDPQTLSESLLQREQSPRSRKPLTDFVFSASWGQVSPLVSD